MRHSFIAGVTIAVLTMAAADGQLRPAAIDAVVQDPAIRSALSAIERAEPQVVEDQVRLCEVPAPPFKEEARARAYKDAFEGLGLSQVRIDAVGNVIGVRPGAGARPNIVVSAHLDTVFPEGTEVKTSRTGTVIKGPGIGDDCRGLALLLGVIRAMADASVQTRGTVTFVGTVGEEGLGDLRGVKHLFDSELKGTVDAFISVDGGGHGITHVAVGSRRYRVAFKGPGGHSYGAFGIANPVHALGRAIAGIADLRVPQDPKTTFNVGRVGGGTSVNSIPYEAWMEVDMRSADARALQELEGGFARAVDAALEAENARWSEKGKLQLEKKLVGDRPAGAIAEDAPIVQTAIAATRAAGLPVALRTGSTDSNYPISLGLPAVTIGGGGRGEGSHSLAESFDTADSWRGTGRTLLLVVALAR
jgi:acetylornithine deacetylase/succinyl-diaminopimelate desuccinylase-like protein